MLEINICQFGTVHHMQESGIFNDTIQLPIFKKKSTTDSVIFCAWAEVDEAGIQYRVHMFQLRAQCQQFDLWYNKGGCILR